MIEDMIDFIITYSLLIENLIDFVFKKLSI